MNEIMQSFYRDEERRIKKMFGITICPRWLWCWAFKQPYKVPK